MKEDILKDYLHQDRLGSTTNLTDQFGRVVGRADYNEWGEITYREALDITSSYRRIWPQSSYTGHDWDDVLGMYYAKARFYSAEDKRFVAMDPVKGQIVEPLSLVAYVYCVDNPLRWVDPLGLRLEHLDDLGGGRNLSAPETNCGYQEPLQCPKYVAAVYLNQSKGAGGSDFSLLNSEQSIWAGHSALMLIKDNGQAEYYSYAADPKNTAYIIAAGVISELVEIEEKLWFQFTISDKLYPTVPGYLSVATTIEGEETEILYSQFNGVLYTDTIASGNHIADEYDRGIYIPIEHEQGQAMHDFAQLVRNNPGGYNLTQNNCTMKAMDILNAGGIYSQNESYIPNLQYSNMMSGDIWSSWGNEWGQPGVQVTGFYEQTFEGGARAFDPKFSSSK